MLYKRSSFIKWLIDTYECEVTPLRNNPNILIIKHFNESTKMGVNPKDVIDYEEIYLHTQRLSLPSIPGDSDLMKAD